MSVTNARLRAIPIRPARVVAVAQGGMILPSDGPLPMFGLSGRSRRYVIQCRRSGAGNIGDEATAVVTVSALSKSRSAVEVSSSDELRC
jgi:hypothetical protein